jgi:phenylalanyl-tRNA synthetase alpha chain|tara:strand:+ start:3328 stop:4857 length:1530 start_codon:yes stop_codon:yes gene_type:complete
MEIEKIILTLHAYERKVLPALKETTSFEEITKKTGLQKVEVMRALQWLQNKKLIRINKRLQEQVSLDENGIKYRANGLPERKFLEAIKENSTLEELSKKTNLSRQELSISLGMLKSKSAIEIKKEKGLIISITDIGKDILKKGFPEEEFLKKKFPINSSELKDLDKLAFENLKKRNRIVKVTIVKIINAEPTETGEKIIEHGISGKEMLDRLTPKALKSGEWKTKKLRSYDVKINVPNISGGKQHFVNQAIQYIKRIWLDLGFKEMTGNLVQTSFWDLDALFVPQDHPARDMQDTFYIKNPKYGKLPKELVKNIKAAHENGFTTGSKGWQYKWSDEIAKENLLRTHTTVLSAQTIAKLKKEDLPAKFFSVGKVFRNETLSWKSLFEFIQVEGIVIDPNANFKNLKGYLKEFFAKMGFPDVRIRPAHFPYTEPSAEVDVWHPIKKQWVELGGSGIFRPEMVKPLIGIEVPVLAWGLGMERTIMEYYNIKDARDVYKNDLKQLRESRIWMK